MRRVLVIVAALGMVVASSTPAGGHPDDLRVGISQPLKHTATQSGACVTTTTIWVQELGKSGVTKLAAKFERRGKYDTGLPFLTYGESGWVYSHPFPDDARSFYGNFSYTPTHPGGEYSFHVIGKGIRPGFWLPDRKLRVVIGTGGCYAGQYMTEIG